MELVELLKNGDASAYTVIYNRYFDMLYLHAYRRLNDQEEAQDIIHELFALLWTKREVIDIRTNLSAYLLNSVRNKILDLIAHRAVESKYVNSLQDYLQHGTCITDHLIREKLLSQLIDKSIADLPSRMKEVFELSRQHKLTHKEIAEKLNLSEETVKKQVTNALKILRVKLGTMLFVQL
ncbi:ECF RNA polymerase sigma factor SigW [compost metagenome]